jgi:hypothetical protein
MTRKRGDSSVIRVTCLSIPQIGEEWRDSDLTSRGILAQGDDRWLADGEGSKLNFFEKERPLCIVRINKMDESELNRHLKTISERPIPNLPSDLAGSIRAKIGREAAIRENWLDRLVSTLLRPQWATAVLAITLLVGGNLGRVLANSVSHPVHRPLGFEVFAADAPTLPSTLLGRSR